ncbi:MAG TPA: endonuclease [Streptomyces sp.]|nr:endonuclease [Streptomyces sp.]
MSGTGRTKKNDELVRALLDEQGRTYADEAGIRLKDTPQSLYQLLVLSLLLSARIRADIAVASARALFAAGMRDARRMADATWQQRVDALGEGGYRRYDERTATQLGDGAELLLDRYGGDLRRLRAAAGGGGSGGSSGGGKGSGGGGGDVEEEKALLQEFPGIGPTGADIFLREAQGVWPELRPYIDSKALAGAERVGLPGSPAALAKLVDGDDLPRLAAALVRVALDKEATHQVRETVGA